MILEEATALELPLEERVDEPKTPYGHMIARCCHIIV